MIYRLVKMQFAEEEIPQFLDLFGRYRQRIAGFPGCAELKLLRGHEETGVFFTYSVWESPEHLEGYRQSDLFSEVWPATKRLFMAKPEAWTLQLEKLNDIPFSNGSN
jgi:heme-degrading monooxygenase HmoA